MNATTMQTAEPLAHPAAPLARPAPEPVILILADISGYTRYMTANATSLAHSQLIITELFNAILSEVELPLALAEVEGDAVFLYGRKQFCPLPTDEARLVIGARLARFLDIFAAKVKELSRGNHCTCQACTHLPQLQLKVLAHSGEALFYELAGFRKLSGVDVILAHRLLKNSVPHKHYIMLTEAARADVELPAHMEVSEGVEVYEDIGPIRTRVYRPRGAEPVLTQARPQSNVLLRLVRQLRFHALLWWTPFVERLRRLRAGTRKLLAAT